MAFVIKKIIGSTPNDIHAAICAALRESRFTARVVYKINQVTIHDVRLRESKHYCGNHPLPCPVRPGVKERHVKAKFLEGADWVGFNDMLNDVLDTLKVSCSAGSPLVTIRKGLARCIRYDAKPVRGDFNEWAKDSGQFIDMTKGPIESPTPNWRRSEYPEGTPGDPRYRMV